MTLTDLGWNELFAAEFAPYELKGWQPGRLVRGNRITYGALIAGPNDLVEVEATLSGKVYHAVETDAELPAVGDWVALEVDVPGQTAMIKACLKRQSCLSRRAVGESEEEQVIAANISTVVVVTDAGADFNLRRMERFFSVIARSGAKAVVLLNKADLFSNTKNLRAARAIARLQAAADVHVTSAKTRKGLAIVKGYLEPGQTVAFIGSSGVGKSALINRLLGDDAQWTGSVNEATGKGRHTTTARELMLLPGGGMIIDNPGIKEVQMWTDERTLRESFSDIAKLADQCEFDDCKHGTDTGCALRAALAKSTLSPERLKAYLDMDGEIKKLEVRRLQRKSILERRNMLKQRDKSREWVQFGGEREDEYKNAGRPTQ
jgi:ribosome biogenesis GTPase / thiamine phosphate phosphatase